MTQSDAPPSTLRKALWWLLILVPLILCAVLMRKHTADQRFLDDWLWAQDLVKFGRGELHLSDLFEVHMEHRPALARAMAMLSTYAAKGNVRAQNLVTFVLLLGAYAGIVRVFLRKADWKLQQIALPMILVGALMFSPVQWQTLLWPCCCGTVTPLFFLSVSMCFAVSDLPWWGRCLGGILSAALATIGFASGMSVWVLPLPVMLFCGRWENMKQRLVFTGVWLVALAAVLVPYFHHFVNAVPRQYAYGHGEENTFEGALPFFLGHPLLDLHFVASFCGALLVRGLATTTQIAATTVGTFLLLGFTGATVYLFRHWKDETLRSRLLPLLCIGSYSIAAAAMVAMGRIYAGGVGTGLNMRYTAHQTLLPAMLVLAFVVIARHRREKSAVAGTAFSGVSGLLAGGMLVGFLVPGWIYGSTMMEEWQNSRYRDTGAQTMSQLFNWSRSVAIVGGNFDITKDTTDALDKLGLLHPRPLRDTKLSNIPEGTAWLDDRHGEFSTFRKEDGEWMTRGFSLLRGSWRPADGILFAYKVEGGEWTIFGMTQPRGIPHFLSVSMGKDVQYIIHGRAPWPGNILSNWGEKVDIISEPPQGARISAWALDAHRMLIYPVGRGVGMPVEKAREGFTLEQLATKPKQAAPEDHEQLGSQPK